MLADPRVRVFTGGHPFARDTFGELFDAVSPGWEHVEHPDALTKLSVASCAEADVLVFYDMPGIQFTRADPPALFATPPPSVVKGFHELMEAGKGLVFLHHAVASWPAWPEFASIVGARFHYQPGEFNGVHYQDSGYRFDVTHEVSVLDASHPVCAGLPTSFSLTDELYLFPVDEANVIPLLRTSFAMDDSSQFYSADLAIRGERNSNRGWSHPIGSSLVGWVKTAGNSPVVYLQFGDGPTTYADPTYRQVLRNAIRWAASPEAAEWASGAASAVALPIADWSADVAW